MTDISTRKLSKQRHKEQPEYDFVRFITDDRTVFTPLVVRVYNCTQAFKNVKN